MPINTIENLIPSILGRCQKTVANNVYSINYYII